MTGQTNPDNSRELPVHGTCCAYICGLFAAEADISSKCKDRELGNPGSKYLIGMCWKKAGKSHHQLQLLQLLQCNISQCVFPALYLELQAKTQHAPECHGAASQMWCLN